MTTLLANPSVLVQTPEGIDVRFLAATASERIAAMAIDLVVLALGTLALGLMLTPMFGVGVILLLVFFARHGYFLWLEARGRGTTIGKRLLRLRVIRADGGSLSVGILLARNLTREVELFLPLMVLMSPEVVFSGHDGVLRLVATLWFLVFLFLPLASRERLRLGDLLAGTRVVLAPRLVLARDLADAAPWRAPGAEAVGADTDAGEFAFTAGQLSIYGEHELGVLEGVLRKGGNSRDVGYRETLAAVTTSICRRIGWSAPPAPADQARFLRAFYAAQRQHLEQQLLLGRRRAEKRGRGRAPAPPPRSSGRRAVPPPVPPPPPPAPPASAPPPPPPPPSA